MFYKTYYKSPIGELLIASDGENLIGLWIEGQKYYLEGINEELILRDDLQIFIQTKEWLDRYFRGEVVQINEFSLAPIGNEFRQEVWKILCDIPYGEVITYGEIAKKMSKQPMSAQAVGGAVGHNPISIIIPCHRVIGSNGNLTGYAGGIDKKVKLLELENANI